MSLMRLGLLVPAIIAVAAAAQKEIVLPEGKGKEFIENACTMCHDLERIVALKLTKEAWRNTIRQMIENGATFNAEETAPILDYLAINFGPPREKVNINNATAVEIAEGLELARAEADAIVRYRSKNGRFKTPQDLAKVPGVGKRLESRKDRIRFDEPARPIP